MKYYVLAGEASGDLHGSNLIKAIKALDSQPDFKAWGGDLMEQAGASLVKHYKELAFMGFVEVVANLRTILNNIRFCKRDISAYEPDVLILIDYPGFNMRIAKWAKAQGIKVVYYISPQIWAWKQNRAHDLKRDVDLMLCILPFEQKFYQRFKMDVSYVGHPLLDAIENRSKFNKQERINRLGLTADKSILLLMPGSRQQEIKTMLPIMLRAAEQLETHQAVVAGAPSQNPEFYQELMGKSEIPIYFGETYNLLEIADLAAVTSGTATLETALFKVPEVVCYKGSFVSYHIAKRLIKVPYISLVNLIADTELVKELIQGEFNAPQLTKQLRILAAGDKRNSLMLGYEALTEKLGGGGASMRAAKEILKLVHS